MKKQIVKINLKKQYIYGNGYSVIDYLDYDILYADGTTQTIRIDGRQYELMPENEILKHFGLTDTEYLHILQTQ